MRYFYARVSTREQELGRQLVVAEEWKPCVIYCDKQSGKNFDRCEYRKMISALREGDEVIVKELDRLGRNKAMVREEIKWFNEHGIILRILDIPTTLMDFGNQKWVSDMVTNILIEVLGTIAEQEREKTLRRQREGIDAMPIVDGYKVSAKTGRRFGRESIPCPEFWKVYEEYKKGHITLDEGLKKLNISRSKWYRLANG